MTAAAWYAGRDVLTLDQVESMVERLESLAAASGPPEPCAQLHDTVQTRFEPFRRATRHPRTDTVGIGIGTITRVEDERSGGDLRQTQMSVRVQLASEST